LNSCNQDGGDCNTFVADLLARASGGYSGPAFTIDMLNATAAGAGYYDGTPSQLITNYQGTDITISGYFASHPNSAAISETWGGQAYIYLNSSFFSPSAANQQVPMLIHEWVHGLNSNYLTDELLAGILGWNGRGEHDSASSYLSQQFLAHCQ
jgi:hypothetical protein